MTQFKIILISFVFLMSVGAVRAEGLNASFQSDYIKGFGSFRLWYSAKEGKMRILLDANRLYFDQWGKVNGTTLMADFGATVDLQQVDEELVEGTTNLQKRVLYELKGADQVLNDGQSLRLVYERDHPWKALLLEHDAVVQVIPLHVEAGLALKIPKK